MVLGAVLDAGVSADAIRAALASLELPIELEIEKVKRCGFAATKATIHAKDQEDYRFLPDVERILRRTPRERQTALFSATVPTVIRVLSRRYMYEPASVHVQPEQVTVEEVEQVYYEVAERDKVDGLICLIQQDPP